MRPAVRFKNAPGKVSRVAPKISLRRNYKIILCKNVKI